jgi:aspartate racemase
VKTIGVLGGIGPQATMDFERRLHRVCQQLLPQRFNAGYPPIIVYYNRWPAFATNDDGTTQRPLTAHPRLLEAARQLGAVADFLVITSNATHLFRDAIERAAGKPVLSMIDLAVDEVVRRGCRRVGVLGYNQPIVYTQPLTQRGLSCETIDPDLMKRLDVAISHVMEGRADDDDTAAARAAVDTLRGRNVDGVILGCTEIPLLLGDAATAPDLLDPLDLLADAAVRAAI